MREHMGESGGDAPNEGVSAGGSTGVPGGARQNVRTGTSQGAVAQPGGATQNSGGAQPSTEDECGHGPGRGAD